MAYGRRPHLGRLDLLCLGASPEKLAARQAAIPAVDVPALTDAQQQRLYVLNHHFARTGGALSIAELLERQRLQTLKHGRRK